MASPAYPIALCVKLGLKQYIFTIGRIQVDELSFFVLYFYIIGNYAAVFHGPCYLVFLQCVYLCRCPRVFCMELMCKRFTSEGADVDFVNAFCRGRKITTAIFDQDMHLLKIVEMIIIIMTTKKPPRSVMPYRPN